MGKIETPKLGKEDFWETTAPDEWLYGYRKNRLELKQLTNRLLDMAKALGTPTNLAARERQQTG